MEFKERAYSVVRDFIRTVLIIDDDWPDGTEPIPGDTLPAPADAFLPPTSAMSAEESADGQLSEPGGNGSEETPLMVPPALFSKEAPDSGQWTLLKIGSAVTKSGALFCGMRYAGAPLDDLRRTAIELARRADVLILDWHLVGMVSDDALAIIKSLHDDGGLRFVCIYTGQERIGDVRAAIETHVGVAAVGDDARDFRIGNINIAVRSKPSIIGAEFVEPENLFETAVRSVARTYSGLVQLALLEVTSRHRDQLPKMLSRFDADTDTAFVYEATDQISPVGPEGPFLTLMLDEWRALLESSVRSLPMTVLSGEGIGSFLRERYGSRAASLTVADVVGYLSWAFGPDHGKSKTCDDTVVARIEAWVNAGLQGKPPGATSGGTWNEKEEAVARWALVKAILDPKIEDKPPKVFAPLMSLEVLFQQQHSIPDRLTQGTVLKYIGDKYLICITPVCDAVRPAKIDHTFGFLVGKRVEIDKTPRKHNGLWVLINDGGVPTAVSIDEKPVVALRVPDGTLKLGQGVIGYRPFPAQPTAGSDMTVSLLPVAQLRGDHALALAQAAAAEASRVGLDRGEFIRSRFGEK